MISWTVSAISPFVLLALLAGCGLATSNEDRLARAEADIAAGEYRSAMIELKNVLGSDADSIDARLLLARVSLGLGDVLAAEKELQRAADLGASEDRIHPLHFDILAKKGDFSEMLASLGMGSGGLTEIQQLKFRGKALLALGSADEALASYNDWAALEPESVQAAVGIANATAGSGKLPAAIGMLEALVDKHPDSVHAWRSLGILGIQVRNYEQAETAFRTAAELSRPEEDILQYVSVLAALTEIRLGLDRKEDARASLERLTRVAPNAPATILLAARLARSDGDYDQAALQLQTLLRIDPDNSQALLFLAEVQTIRGNVEQAAQILNRLIAVSPDNIQARKLLAQIQLTQSQPVGVIEALAPFLVNENTDVDLYRLLAHASLQQGDTGTAIERFRSAVELAPDSAERKLDLAAGYLGAGDASQSLGVLANVPEGEGESHRREYLLMLALDAVGRSPEADDVAEKMLRESANDSAAVTIVADRYMRTDRTEAARRTLRDFLRTNSADIDAMTALARIELANDNLDDAATLLTNMRTAEPDNLFALLGLARIAELSGDEGRKVELLKAAVDAHEESVVPRAWLATVYVAQARKREAEALVNEVIAAGFANAQISEIVGNVLMDVGRSADAVVHLENAARINPGSPNTELSLARAYLTQDRSVDAKIALQRALRSKPGWLPAQSILTLIELRQGNLASASGLVAELRAAHPDNAGAMLLEGEVLLYQRNFNAAAAVFRQAAASGAGRSAVLKEYQARRAGRLPQPESALLRWLDTAPVDGVARSILAQHYQGTADDERAVVEYEKVLELQPDNTAVLNNLAWLYQAEGRLDLALEFAEKAYALDPSIGSIADTLGWIYRSLGELDKSLEMLSHASQLAPDNGEISFHLALVMSETGDVRAARDILRDLIEGGTRFPSRTQAEQLLAQL